MNVVFIRGRKSKRVSAGSVISVRRVFSLLEQKTCERNKDF